MKKFNKYLALIIVALLIITTIFTIITKQNRHNTQIKNMYEAAADSLVIYKNKHNQEVARITTIQAERNKDFLKIKTQDSTIITLQQLVDTYKSKLSKGGTATIVEVETIIKDTIPIFYTDSIIYFSDYNEWIELNGEIKDSSLLYSLIVNNKFKMVTGEEKGKPITEFISENPYTHTNILRVYQNTGRKKRFTLSTGAGVVAGVNLLTLKPSLTGGIYVGVGYKIFDF